MIFFVKKYKEEKMKIFGIAVAASMFAWGLGGLPDYVGGNNAWPVCGKKSYAYVHKEGVYRFRGKLDEKILHRACIEGRSGEIERMMSKKAAAKD